MREHGISWLVMLNLPLLLSLIFDLMLNVVTRCCIGKLTSNCRHVHRVVSVNHLVKCFISLSPD